MKKYISIFLIAALSFTGCKVDDVLDSPNNPGLSDVDPTLLLLGVQENVNDLFTGLSQDGMNATRMIATFPRGGTYETFYQPQDFDEDWIDAYADLLLDIDALIPIAEETGLTTHAAIAKIVQAYVLVTMVDFFGDVPFSQAFQGSENFNPRLDDAETLYQFAYDQCLAALDDLNAIQSGSPTSDLFYSPLDYTTIDLYEDEYRRLAYTMMLKIDLQRRLVDNGALGRIQDLIDTASFVTNSWKYDFSTNILNPDSRHAYFGINYDNGASIYMSNSYMNSMLTDKGLADPRIRYYFYRQETTFPVNDAVNAPCSVEPGPPAHYGPDDSFCNPGGGYWGRDHIDNDGIPPDTGDRTVYGLWPVGGRFDLGDDEAVNQDTRSGAGGAGYHPYIMDYAVQFMLAEYYLVTNQIAAARTALSNGLTLQFNEVRAFADASPEAARVSAFEDLTTYNANRDGYINEVLVNRFDAATTLDERMQIVIKEYWYASFGNGIEMYNTYRRTGYPNDLQPALNPDAGVFFRSMPYPSNVINRNSNISSKGGVDVPVFWDTNPEGFVD